MKLGPKTLSALLAALSIVAGALAAEVFTVGPWHDLLVLLAGGKLTAAIVGPQPAWGSKQS